MPVHLTNIHAAFPLAAILTWFATLLVGIGLTSSAAVAHGHMVYPKSRAAEHMSGDQKNWPIAGIPSRLRREPCAGLKPNSELTVVRPGPLTLRLLFPDGANHRGYCTAYLYDPLKPDHKLKIGKPTNCAQSLLKEAGRKGQDVPGEMLVTIPEIVPCNPNHCVLLWEWTATHVSETNFERFEHYDNCSDIKIIGARRGNEEDAKSMMTVPEPESGSISSDFFQQEWRLNPNRSSLHLQSVKNESVFETHGFEHMEGTISPEGDARISLDLTSFDTGIDLRNVRMQFLFFETFRFPEAVITAKLDRDALEDLAKSTSISYPLEFSINLHGVEKKMTRNVVVTRIADSAVSVSATKPITIPAKDFALQDGVGKLEEAASVDISPVASITFHLVFEGSEINPEIEQIYSEKESARSEERYQEIESGMCETRFSVLSDSRSVFFKTASSELGDESRYALDQIAEFAFRCPDIKVEVGGHTDNVGRAASNFALSQARSQSVVNYLVDEGVPSEMLVAVGYGDTNPVAPNNTVENRARNRRIEFNLIRQ